MIFTIILAIAALGWAAPSINVGNKLSDLRGERHARNRLVGDIIKYEEHLEGMERPLRPADKQEDTTNQRENKWIDDALKHAENRKTLERIRRYADPGLVDDLHTAWKWVGGALEDGVQYVLT